MKNDFKSGDLVCVSHDLAAYDNIRGIVLSAKIGTPMTFMAYYFDGLAHLCYVMHPTMGYLSTNPVGLKRAFDV